MLANWLEQLIFAKRRRTLWLLIAATLLLLAQAVQLKIDAGFEKHLPQNHPYMAAYTQYEAQFGGANRLLIAPSPKQGDIFTQEFMATLKSATDDVYFIPGVDRARVSSIFTPDVRFIEVDEQGFAGGNVIPAEFAGTPEDLAQVRENVLKSGQVGRLVANDFSAAMISAQLLERDPATGARLDYFATANKLEELRQKYPDVSVHVVGYAQIVGDVAAGVKSVAMFFAIAIAITFLLVLWYTRSAKLSGVLVGAALVAVIWQMGLMVTLGYGIDPMSILLPFLIFAIATSHGVQMITAMGHELTQPGATPEMAARAAFRRLLGPGSTALITDVVGFMTLLLITIPMVRELGLTASVGVAVILITNLVLLPVWLSYLRISPDYASAHQQLEAGRDRLWLGLQPLATRKVAIPVLVLAIAAGAWGWQAGQGMIIGDADAGVPELHPDSRYNTDVRFITSHFSTSTDILTVIAETVPNACVEADVVNYIDAFSWHIANLPGVQSTMSMPQMMKVVSSGWNEGNLKWRTLPLQRGESEEEQARIRSLLTQASRPIETATGLLNADCSVMPVYIFLRDHKAETIDTITGSIKEWLATNPFTAREDVNVKLRLATGYIGVMAATNDAVRDAQWPMLIAVYVAVAAFCFLTFRSIIAVLCCLLPLVLVGLLANALMAGLGIGLKVATLPVAALGVGIGVDYAIYIYSRLQVHLEQGHALTEAWLKSLRETGSAVLFTGLTLAAGVSTWIFSALKFQADMGLLLTFMFLVNMLAAVILLPALAALFIRSSSR